MVAIWHQYIIPLFSQTLTLTIVPKLQRFDALATPSWPLSITTSGSRFQLYTSITYSLFHRNYVWQVGKLVSQSVCAAQSCSLHEGLSTESCYANCYQVWPQRMHCSNGTEINSNQNSYQFPFLPFTHKQYID